MTIRRLARSCLGLGLGLLLSFAASAVQPDIDASGPYVLRSDGSVFMISSSTGAPVEVLQANAASKLGGNGLVLLQDGTVTKLAGTKATPVAGLSGIVEVSGGRDHSLALNSNGLVWAWGINYSGQLGNGMEQFEQTGPFQVPGIGNVVHVHAGLNGSFAITSSGELWAWGRNSYGKLIDGTETDRWVPTRSTLTSKVIGVSSGNTTHVIMADGSYKAFGWNGCTLTVPVGEKAVKVNEAGWSYYWNFFLLTDQGNVHSCGSTNENGQLGNNTTSSSYSTQKINLSGVMALSVTQSSSYAITTDGKVWAWGTPARLLIPTVQKQIPTAGLTGTIPGLVVPVFSCLPTDTSCFTFKVSNGWTMLGNPLRGAIDPAAAFADTTKFTSVWTWNSATNNWAFYAPSLSATELANHVASKGFSALTSIAPGQGFWVNATAAASVIVQGPTLK